MSYWGDFPLGETLNFLFTTRAFATGIPTVLAGTPVLSVYEDTNLTQITAGVTITVDHDAVVGLNRANVVATSGNGYEVGKSYNVVITTGTVGGVSVVGEVIGIFTVERSAAVRPTVAGRTLDIAATGEAGVDFGNILGTLDAAEIGTDAITSAKIAANAIGASELATDAIGDAQIATAAIASTAFAAGAINAAAIATDAITAAKIAADAIGASELATDAIGDAQIATGAIASTAFAAGAIDAAAIATDAIGSAEIAANALTSAQIADSARDKINAGESFHALTADSGTTATLVDAALTQADDYWNSMVIVFTSGPNVGLSRVVNDFDAVTDTMTFAPVLLTAVAAGHNYYIANRLGVISRDGVGDADVKLWQAVSPNALVAGAVDADVSAIQANVITAASIATDAITAAKIEANAIGAAEIATDAIGSAQIAANAIGASELATDAIGSAQIAAGAITSSEAPNLDAAVSTRATPAQVNTEVSDVLKTDTITLPGQAAPPLAPTFEQALSWLYKVLRNRKTQTATQWSLLADDETTVDAKATVSDDATTAIKQEIVTGP